MGSAAKLFWVMLFGAIGTGFFMYGRKQRRVVPLLTGVVLFIYPYFISNTVLIVVLGAVLIVLPYFIRA